MISSPTVAGLYPLNKQPSLPAQNLQSPDSTVSLGAAGRGALAITVSANGQKQEETECKVNSKTEREMYERIQDPMFGNTQIRTHLKAKLMSLDDDQSISVPCKERDT